MLCLIKEWLILWLVRVQLHVAMRMLVLAMLQSMFFLVTKYFNLNEECFVVLIMFELVDFGSN